MRIQFETGGGVAGPAARRACEIDTDRLSAADAAELKALLSAANLRALARRPPSPPGRVRPDDTYYELTLHDQGQSHSVSVSHLHMPPELRPLVQWLAGRAIPGSAGGP